MYATLNQLYAGFNVRELLNLADRYLDEATVAAKSGKLADARKFTTMAAEVRGVVKARRIPAEMQTRW